MSKFTKLWFSIFNRRYSVYYSERGLSSTFLLGRQYTFTSKPLCPTRFSKLRKFPRFLAQLLRRVALCLLIRHVNGFPLRKKLWKHMKIYWISIIMEVPLNSVVILKRRLPAELKSAVSNVQPFFNCTDTPLFLFVWGWWFFSPEVIYFGHPFNMVPTFTLLLCRNSFIWLLDLVLIPSS